MTTAGSTTCAVKCRDLASSLIVLWTLINVLWPATRRRLLQLHTWEVVKTLLHPSISQFRINGGTESIMRWTNYSWKPSPIKLQFKKFNPPQPLKRLRQKIQQGENTKQHFQWFLFLSLHFPFGNIFVFNREWNLESNSLMIKHG